MICLTCKKSLENTPEKYGHHDKCFKKTFGKAGEFTNFNRLGSDSFNSKKREPNYLISHFSGNYRKYEAHLENEKFILKFQETAYPELVGVEFLCNQLGRALKIPVSDPFGIIKFENEEESATHDYAFVVKNFLKPSKGPVNLVHIYHYLDDQSYSVEALLKIIKRQTGHENCYRTFLNTVLYDALIGNHDRHGRNLAFIETKKGKILSPIYDNISALGLESNSKFLEATWDPKGKIYTQDSQEPGMKEYVNEIKRLEEYTVLQGFKQTLEKADVLRIVEDAPLLSTKMKEALKALIQKRIQAFDDATRTL